MDYPEHIQRGLADIRADRTAQRVRAGQCSSELPTRVARQARAAGLDWCMEDAIRVAMNQG